MPGSALYDHSWQNVDGGVAFPYPAFAGLVFVPFALIPHAVSDAVFTVLCMAAVVFTNLGNLLTEESGELARDVAFLAPVQQAGSQLHVEVSNVPDHASVLGFLGCAWPAILAFILWGYGWATNRTWFRSAGWIIGWLLLVWAALRCANGAVAFLVVLGAFLLLHVLIPALRRLWLYWSAWRAP